MAACERDGQFQYPHARGAIFAYGVKNLEIRGCNFTGNDPGPTFSQLQRVGLTDALGEAWGQVCRASAIRISSYCREVKIVNNSFKGNNLDFLKQLVTEKNIDLRNFFPDDYFQVSHAPIIHVDMLTFQELGGRRVNVTIEQNKFLEQRHSEALGGGLYFQAGPDIQYYGSLLAARNANHQLVVFNGNLVEDQIFYGTLTALIAAYGASVVHLSNNIVRNVGFINTEQQISLPFRATEGSNRTLPFSPTTISRSQQTGLIELSPQFPGTAESLTTEPLDPGDAHIFEGNLFRNVYAKQAGVINTDYVGNYKTLKIVMRNNQYIEVFSNQAAILRLAPLNLPQARGGEITKEFVEAAGMGFVHMKNETVIESGSFREALLFLSDEHNNGLLNLIMEDCQFIGNFQGAIEVHQALLFARNSVITSAVLPLESSQFEAAKEKHANTTVAEKLKQPLIAHDLSSFASQIELAQASNPWRFIEDLEIKFGNFSGFEEIFDGFELQNETLSVCHQLKNLTFSNQTLPYQESLIKVHDTTLFLKDVQISKIQGLLMESKNSDVFIHSVNAADNGLELINSYGGEMKQVIQNFYNQTQQTEEQSKFLQSSGFISQDTSNLEIFNSTFTNSIFQEGLIVKMGEGDLNLDHCFVKRIFGLRNTAIIAASVAQSSNHSMSNSVIEDTLSLRNSIDLQELTMDFTNVTFNGIFAFDGANGIIFVVAGGIIQNCTVNNTQDNFNLQSINGIKIDGVQTGFIQVQYGSEVAITNVHAEGLRASFFAFLNSQEQSSIFISNTTIQNCTGVGLQSALNFDHPKALKLENTILNRTKGITITSKRALNNGPPQPGAQNGFQIINVTLLYGGEEEQESQINIKGMSGIIKDSIFERIEEFTYQESQESLYFSDIDSLRIENSQFRNMIQKNGGAFFAKDIRLVQIEKSLFENNQGYISGGGLFFEDCSQIKVSNSIFTRNTAAKLDNGHLDILDFQRNQYEGGAILAKSSDQCLIRLIKNSFLGNMAQAAGGSISIANDIIEFEEEGNIFENCRDGANQCISWPIAKLVPVLDEEKTKVVSFEKAVSIISEQNQAVTDESQEGFTQLRNILEENGISDQVMIVPSGQNLNMEIKIQDKFGNLIQSGQYIYCDIKVVSLMDYQDLVDLPDQEFRLQGSELQAVNGIFYFNQMTITSKSRHLALLTYEFSDLSGENPQEISPQLILFRKCTDLEENNKDGSCNECGYGFYLLRIQDETLKKYYKGHEEEHQNCQRCFENAICFGGDLIVPTDRYYRYRNDQDFNLPCIQPFLCYEGDSENYQGTCLEGYEGFMCGGCQQNYQRTVSHSCNACEKVIRKFLAQTFWLLLMIETFNYAISQYVQNESSQKPILMLKLIMLLQTIFFHSYLMNIIQTNIQFFQIGQDFFQKYGGSEFYLFSNFYDFQCLIQKINPEIESEKIHEIQVICSVFYPFVMIGIVALKNWILALVKKQQATLKDTQIRSSIIIMWFFFNDILNLCVEHLSCINIHLDHRTQETTMRAKYDLRQECFTGSHLSLIATIVGPTIFFYLICFPAAIQYKLYLNRDIINLDKNVNLGSLPTPERKRIREFQRQFGFYYMIYRKNCWHWGVGIQVYLVVFSFIVQLTNLFAEPIIVAFVSILMTMMFCANLLSQTPSQSLEVNKLLLFSQRLLYSVSFFGLFFVTDVGLNKTMEVILLTLNHASSYLFQIYWSWCFKDLVMVLIFQGYQKAFKLMTFNLVDLNQFYENKVKPILEGKDSQEAGLVAEVEKQKVTTEVTLKKRKKQKYEDNQQFQDKKSNQKKPFWSSANSQDEVQFLNESLLEVMSTLQMKDLNMLRGKKPENDMLRQLLWKYTRNLEGISDRERKVKTLQSQLQEQTEELQIQMQGTKLAEESVLNAQAQKQIQIDEMIKTGYASEKDVHNYQQSIQKPKEIQRESNQLAEVGKQHKNHEKLQRTPSDNRKKAKQYLKQFLKYKGISLNVQDDRSQVLAQILNSNPELSQNLERISQGLKPILVSNVPQPSYYQLNQIIDPNSDGFAHLVDAQFKQELQMPSLQYKNIRVKEQKDQLQQELEAVVKISGRRGIWAQRAVEQKESYIRAEILQLQSQELNVQQSRGQSYLTEQQQSQKNKLYDQSEAFTSQLAGSSLGLGSITNWPNDSSESSKQNKSPVIQDIQKTKNLIQGTRPEKASRSKRQKRNKNESQTLI